MKTYQLAFLFLASPLWAQDSGAVTLPIPPPLDRGERIADHRLFPAPPPPKQYFDGSALVLTNETDRPPQGPALQDLTIPGTIQRIPVVDRRDHRTGHYYWYPFEGWNFCHYPQGKLHWYGWRTGGTFHWVLWGGEHFWWRDAKAGRWLFFNQGYWWWPGVEPGKGRVLLRDGLYHAWDDKGVVLEDPGPKGDPGPPWPAPQGGPHAN